MINQKKKSTLRLKSYCDIQGHCTSLGPQTPTRTNTKAEVVIVVPPAHSGRAA